MMRVAKRVRKGGHNVPKEIIERRFYRGISNLLKLYISICDNWMVIDNMDAVPDVVALGGINGEVVVKNDDIWNIIVRQSKNNG